MIYYPDGNPAENGLLITPQMIEESNLSGLGHEVHTMDGVIVVISDQLEALELIRTSEVLNALSNKLLTHLGDICGKCDECIQYGGKCWAKDLEDQVVRVPDWAKKAAGIPLDSNLILEVDDGCMLYHRNTFKTEKDADSPVKNYHHQKVAKDSIYGYLEYIVEHEYYRMMHPVEIFHPKKK